MRGGRDFLTELFKSSEQGIGFYHFTDEKLVARAEEFLVTHCSYLGTFRKYEIYAFALLVYPTMGIQVSSCKGKVG